MLLSFIFHLLDTKVTQEWLTPKDDKDFPTNTDFLYIDPDGGWTEWVDASACSVSRAFSPNAFTLKL